MLIRCPVQILKICYVDSRYHISSQMVSPSSTILRVIVTVSIFVCLITIHTVVEVGLVPLNRSVSENETFQVCAQLTAGRLGCNITVPLDVATEDNSTIGKTVPSLTHFNY